MWHPKQDSSSRGGFQNRHSGPSDSDQNYGPDYGVDYARFSDVPNLEVDANLKERIRMSLNEKFPEMEREFDLFVRNGFVFMKVHDGLDRRAIKETLMSLGGVRDLIIQEIH